MAEPSTALIERPPGGEILGAESPLAELAATANREHALVVQAGVSMVEHAIAAGEALAAIRERTPEGEWHPWVDEYFHGGRTTAKAYMRIAFHRDRIRTQGITSVAKATLYLRGLNGPHPTGRRRTYSDAVRAEAQRLHASGTPVGDIGRLLDVPSTTVRVWLSPEYEARSREYQRRSRERQKARRLRAQEADAARAIKRAVRKAGAATQEAWAMAERMQDVLAQAQRETEDRQAREALSRAGEHYRKMRDEIVRALGVA